MKSAILVTAALLVVACSGKPQAVRDAEHAEAELRVMKASNPMPTEVCHAEQKVASAWLKALDQKKYSLAKSIADIDCIRAEQINSY